VHAAAIALAALSLLSDSHAAAGAEVALLTPVNGATIVHTGELGSAPTSAGASTGATRRRAARW
jgi:hypothetical protein